MKSDRSVTMTERVFDLGAKLIAVLVAIFLVTPILVIFPLSFTSDSLMIFPLPGVSMRWYVDFFTNPVWLTALRNSLMLAVVTMVVATVLGTLAALGLVRLSRGWRSVVSTLLLSPLIVPVIIIGVGTFFYFARLGLAGSFFGLVLAHTVLALPLVVIAVTATLEGFDPNLVRAAYASGASPFPAFWHVTRPLIMPGIATGATFAFITSFDEIVCVIFLGGPEFRTLPRQIWSGAKETVTPTIAVAAVLLVVASVVMTLVVEALRKRAQRLSKGAAT
ncbi:ABC transporter permease [Aminobacter carboxidus]|uniref:ABC transporter permease n=1 Tax=Aminobacter carboxidus TaxID=376165 RepID=A0ABR9GNA4_9HYPH|nr:ABC transporter permease [Aminobacter carboxidus]MBE1205121.1 ABC transporter permease [Aminobacter carboxidus]